MTASHYLRALFDGSPNGSLIEVRHRMADGMGRRFYPTTATGPVGDWIETVALSTDVFVGVLPRRRRGGGRADLVPQARTLWVDCDTAASVAALRTFEPPASVIVRSGTRDNRHA